jgi:surface antigen
MQPLLLLKAASPFKKQVVIVFGVLLAIISLPVIGLVSMVDFGNVGDTNGVYYSGPVSTTNTYIFGYCTFWAALRREQVGKPIPNNWGDAHTWDDKAILAGYLVDHNPTPYAIMETDRGDLGHVAFVENVNPDGSWKISEMNYKGWDQVDDRTLSAAEAKNYNFIHDSILGVPGL